MSFAYRMVRILLGLATAAATGIVLVAQFGRDQPMIDQFNSLLSLLLPLLALALAVAVRTRDWATVATATLGLLVGSWQLGHGVSEGFATYARAAGTSGAELKIMTLSTFHANPKPEAIRQAIAAEAPDIVLLQETNGNAAAVVDTLLPRFHRIKTCDKRHCTLTILSRWPMQRLKSKFPRGKAPPDILTGQVEAPFGRFRVMNVHMPRPYQDDAPAILVNLGTFVRTSQGLPTIMAGDFNTATGSFGLDRLALISNLQRRDGFIPTYPANRLVPAFAGIDHVFADAHWQSGGCRRTGAANSDHYGIACRLRLATREADQDLPIPNGLGTPD